VQQLLTLTKLLVAIGLLSGRIFYFRAIAGAEIQMPT